MNPLRSLCNNGKTRKIWRLSGELISNPLPITHLNPSSIFTINPRKISTSAEEKISDEPETKPPLSSNPSERVLKLVDKITGLTLNEVTDLTDVLRTKLDIKEMPIMTVMMPGMGMPVMPGVKGGAAKAAEGNKPAAKTFFDLKLESFEAAAKIKIIKEVRTFTDLGLKEAKDLVEKTPGLLKKGVAKEEGEQIIAKLKELGAKVVME